MINTPLQCMASDLAVTSHQWVEQTSVWIDEWTDESGMGYVSRDGQHGIAHRLFGKEGCR